MPLAVKGARKLPVLRIRPYPETGEARARVPLSTWATMHEAEKRQVYHQLLTNAMAGAFGDHPGCFFQFHFREMHPEGADLLDASKEPEVICICNVSMYERLK